MKKVMFSAVAIIVFVGSSMASDNAVEGKKKAQEVDCVAVAIAALDAADPNHTMTQAQADRFYQGQYTACINTTLLQPLGK
jgi:hypothetical protein